MCKLLSITGITSRQASINAWRLLYEASFSMSKSDDDGFGYTAYSPQYGLIGERWLEPKHIWTISGGSQRGGPPGDAGTEPAYNRIGTWPTPLRRPRVSAITAHARKSTNNVCLENVHPFVRSEENGDTFALSHNGVVSTTDMDLKGSKECDSMGILNAYVDSATPYLPELVTNMTDKVSGWYACTVLGIVPEGPYVEFFRFGAPLMIVEVSGVGVVWATNEFLVIEAAKKLKLPVRQVWKFKENVLHRVCAKTGDFISQEKFEGKGRVVGYTHAYTNRHRGGSEWGVHAKDSRDDAETEWARKWHKPEGDACSAWPPKRKELTPSAARADSLAMIQMVEESRGDTAAARVKARSAIDAYTALAKSIHVYDGGEG